MPALGWLLNLGFAGGGAVVAAERERIDAEIVGIDQHAGSGQALADVCRIDAPVHVGSPGELCENVAL